MIVRGNESARRNGVKCPKPGCNGKWTLTNSTLDTVFQMKMERFFRTAEIQSQMLSERTDAVELDDDDE